MVLTRFNVELRPGQGRGIEWSWLDERLAIFERVCAPSMRAQHGPARPWLIFVDDRTPISVRNRITAAGLPGQVRIVPIDGPLPDARLQQLVAREIPVERGYLVSTRLDNDDALAVGHLEVVRVAAVPTEAEFLNPWRGFQMAGDRVYATRDPSSPFLSLVERRHDHRAPATAFCAEHRRAAERFPVRQLRGPAMWLQSVHGANLVNSITGIRIDSDRLRGAFDHLAPAHADVHDVSYRLDQVGSAARAAVTRGRRAVLAAWSRGRLGRQYAAIRPLTSSSR